MKRTASTLLILFFLLATSHRLPAPIQEAPESPTPAPEQSAKPKPKQTTKPKATSENSESSTKVKTSSPRPQSKAIPQRNLFDGIWVGTCAHVGMYDDLPITLVISGTEVAVTKTIYSKRYDSGYQEATCDGQTMRWTDTCNWTMTPNSDGKTALVTVNFSGALFGINASHSSATFRKTSP